MVTKKDNKISLLFQAGDPATIATVLRELSKGDSLTACAARLGIHARTLYRWRLILAAKDVQPKVRTWQQVTSELEQAYADSDNATDPYLREFFAELRALRGVS